MVENRIEKQRRNSIFLKIISLVLKIGNKNPNKTAKKLLYWGCFYFIYKMVAFAASNNILALAKVGA